MKQYIEKAIDFEAYLKLIDDLLVDHLTTGPDQSETMYEYARLNRQRMKRLGKLIEIEPEVISKVAELDVDWTWLTITEGWCGDAAQNIPIIEKIAAANPEIRTRYILRDENPQLMDRYLTNGARSIPLLIAFDNRIGKVNGTWGPRPAAGQQMFRDLKQQGMDKAEINEMMQRWYNEDRGRSLQHDLVGLVKDWESRGREVAAIAA